ERVDLEGPDIRIPDLGLKVRGLAGLNRLCFVACGTSWQAALDGKYLVAGFARVPGQVVIAAETRSRHPGRDRRLRTGAFARPGEGPRRSHARAPGGQGALGAAGPHVGRTRAERCDSKGRGALRQLRSLPLPGTRAPLPPGPRGRPQA